MITLSKVSKWYPNFQVLNQCSTEVAKGEVVVVCGPSGSGKSTLIKCVNGGGDLASTVRSEPDSASGSHGHALRRRGERNASDRILPCQWWYSGS